jgi:hypothetical protein
VPRVTRCGSARLSVTRSLVLVDPVGVSLLCCCSSSFVLAPTLLPSLSSLVPKVSREVCVCFRLFVCDSRSCDCDIGRVFLRKNFYRLPFMPPPRSLVKSTGQTGETWAARDEQNPWVNSSKSKSQSPDSLHGFKQDFVDSRNTSWALHSLVMVRQNSLNQEESKDFCQEHHKP